MHMTNFNPHPENNFNHHEASFPHEHEANSLAMQIVMLAGMVEKLKEYKEQNPYSSEDQEKIYLLEKKSLDEDKVERLMEFLENVLARNQEKIFMSPEDTRLIQQARDALDITYTEFLKDDPMSRDYQSAEDALMGVDVVKLQEVIIGKIVAAN